MGALTPLDAASQKKAAASLGARTEPILEVCSFRERGVSWPAPPAAAVVLSLGKREALPCVKHRFEAELLKLWGLTVKSDESERSGYPRHQASAKQGFAGS